MNVARNVRIGPEFDADGQLDSVGATPFGPTRTTNRTHERLGAEGFGPAVVKHCFCDSRRTPLANGGSGAADSPTHAGGSDVRPIPWPPGPRRATGETDRAVAPRPTAPKELSWTLPRASRARNPKRRQRHAQSARNRILRRLTAKLRLVAPSWAPSRAK